MHVVPVLRWQSADYHAGRCSIHMLGTVRRHTPTDPELRLWSEVDVEAGRCLAQEVGTLRLPVTRDEVLSTTPIAPSPTDMVNEAFASLGGIKGLVAWGRSEPAKFYALWARLQPRGKPVADIFEYVSRPDA